MSDNFDNNEERLEVEDNTVQAQEIAATVKQKSMQREIFEWLASILIAVILALLIREFLFTVVKVEGASMEPTLHNNDRLIVWRLGYQPHNNDIIVLHQDGNLPYIKRIIAVEGQTVDINFNTHKVYVDGKEVNEPFIKQPTAERGDVKFPVTVPKDSVFVLGDNRNNSRDSRFSTVGMVKNDDVLGKAVVRILPFNKLGSVYK